jgi:branched-chain amino acid transport system permease protein
MSFPFNARVSICLMSVTWIAAAWLAPLHHADLIFRASTLIVLGISWNLMANAGLISLAHASFSGIGGYAAAIIAKTFGLSLVAALPTSVIAGMLLGAFLAVSTGRLSGLFFAIGTLAVSEALLVMSLMLPYITGGAQGIDVPQGLRLGPHFMGIAAATLAAAALLLSLALSNSRFHYACRAMRSGESAAQMLGLNPRRYRFGVLVISGGLAAGAGGLGAWYTGFLDPRIAFSLDITIVAQIGPLLGGIYTVVGPVFGALALTGVAEATRLGFNGTSGLGQLLYGVILVVSVLLMPHGIVGMFRRLTLHLRGDAARSPASLAVSREGNGRTHTVERM